MRKIFPFFALFIFLNGSAAERIVVLSPAAADAVTAIGARSLLCGRCSACTAPELQKLPVAGALGSPNAEAIFSLRPTLVVSDVRVPGGAWRSLERAGIAVLHLENRTLADFPRNLRRLGPRLKCEAPAERAAARYEEEIAALRRSMPSRKTKVLLLFSIAPAVSCGRDSFLHEAVELAGGINVTGNVKGSYFALSTEFLLQAEPEAIVCAGVPEAAVRRFFNRTEYRSLPAVRNQRFIAVDPDRFCRAGTHLPQEIRELRKKLSAPAAP